MEDSLTDSRHEGSMSNMHWASQVDQFLSLQKIQNRNMIVFAFFSLVVLCLSSYFGDLFGKGASFTDPAKDWQACFTYADTAYIPLTQLTAPLTCLVTTIITPTICDLTDTCKGSITGCLTGLVPGSLHDVSLPTGHFLNGLSYVGIQAVVFGAMAHASIHRALRHPSWLLSTIGLLVWFLFAIFTYYTVFPLFPVPNQTNSTLLVFLLYAGTYTKYKLFNDSDNNCHPAYDYLWVYLSLILVIAGTVAAAVVMSVYAEMKRYTSKNRRIYDPLVNTEIPLVLGAIAVCFYIIISISKILSSATELNSIAAFDYATPAQAGAAGLPLFFPTVWFPFVQPSLDIATILYICAFMSILRGYTIQSVSAFRLAFAAALVFTLTSYPIIVGGIQFYFYNNFDDYDTCWQYFYSGKNFAFFAYPSETQAKNFCAAFRLSFAGNLGLFATMHLITIACYRTFTYNDHRDSMGHEQISDIQRRLTNNGEVPVSNNPLVETLVGKY